MAFVDSDQHQQLLDLRAENTALREQLARAMSETDTAREFVTRLTIEKQRLEQSIVRAAIPYEALLMDAESRKWIAPTIWQEIESTVTAIREAIKEQP